MHQFIVNDINKSGISREPDYNSENEFQKAVEDNNWIVFDEKALSSFISDVNALIKKGETEDLTQYEIDIIEKAKKDISKLHLKTIVDKNGKTTRKWVKNDEANKGSGGGDGRYPSINGHTYRNGHWYGKDNKKISQDDMFMGAAYGSAVGEDLIKEGVISKEDWDKPDYLGDGKYDMAVIKMHNKARNQFFVNRIAKRLGISKEDAVKYMAEKKWGRVAGGGAWNIKDVDKYK